LAYIQLPKILLPEQQSELKSTIANIEELISEELASLEKERKEAADTSSRNKERISELSSKLSDLRKQVKPLEIKGRAFNGHTDELGRERRPTEEETMDVDDEKDQEREREQARNDKEKGVQIRGDDGDVEVEY
jgi:chromosome segregation ATPase